MSYFPHANQNFDEGFDRPMRGPQEMRNVSMRGPPIEQDINSRRFDPRNFPDHRGLDLRQNNGPDFRGMERMPPPGRGLEPPHRHTDMRFEPRPLLDARPNDLRTYDRQPPQPPTRVDPRINFPVGLPPPAMNSSSMPPPSSGPVSQPPFRPNPESISQSPHLHQQPHASPLGLNNPFGGPSLLGQFNRPSVTEIVPVHVDLATFASEPKFQQILLKVKEQSSVNYISLNRIADDLVESIVIDAPSKDAANLARNLIETHLKLQMKIKAAENRLQRVQTDLFSTQGEIAAGQMVEFMIRPELIGLAIGKKGARIRQIEKDTGVSSINVSDNGHIMIYGPDSQSVQRAREQLELVEESFPLNHNQMEWMSDKLNASVLNDLKNGSGVMVGKVNRDTCKLDVVGTNPSVQTAKFLLATQLEYIDKQIEIEANEREAREKLNAVRKQYGLNTPQWKSRSAKPDRSRSPEDTGRRSSDHPSKGARGNDVVDSLIRASMKDNMPSKSVKSQSAFEKERDITFTGKMDSQLEKLVLSVEDELDALISETPQNRKQNDPRNVKPQRPAKELVMQDTFLGANLKDMKDNSSDKGEKGNAGKGRDRDRREKANQGNNNNNRNVVTTMAPNNEPVGKSKGNNAKANNQSNNAKPNADHNSQGLNNNNNKNKHEKGNQHKDEKGNKNKDKPPALKAVNQPSDSSGLLVIPPAPVLVVPPPPTTSGGATKDNNQKNKGKKGRKGENKEDSVLESALVEEKKSVKESMLIKLNNPFLEQKGKKPEEATNVSSRVVSIISDTGTSDSSPKKQDSDKKNRGNKAERNNSNDQATALSKAESVDTSGGKNEGDEQGKSKRRRNRNKNKNQDKADASPAATPKDSALKDSLTASLEAFKVISVTDLEKQHRLDDFEPPLPRPVKKGPPAIPNKVVVMDEAEKKVVQKADAKLESKSDVKVDTSVAAKENPVTNSGSTTSETKDTQTKQDSVKKAASPPGLVAPPGLNKSAAAPSTAPATYANIASEKASAANPSAAATTVVATASTSSATSSTPSAPAVTAPAVSSAVAVTTAATPSVSNGDGGSGNTGTKD